MCLSASLGNDLIITREMLERAVKLITELESQMPAVYGKIGMSENANATLQVLAFLDRYDGKAPFALLYRYMHKHFPIVEDFEKLLLGMIQAGYISINKAERLVIKL
jgi:hypothetical protein